MSDDKSKREQVRQDLIEKSEDWDAFKEAIESGSIAGLNDDVEIKDPNVELTRDTIQMGMAYDKYKEVLPQVTNLDHPIQAMGISSDMTQLEFMRLMGLPEAVYSQVKGEKTLCSGFGGLMKARMGILYPGINGPEFHPRGQLFRTSAGTKPQAEGKSAKSLILDRLFGGQ